MRVKLTKYNLLQHIDRLPGYNVAFEML